MYYKVLKPSESLKVGDFIDVHADQVAELAGLGLIDESSGVNEKTPEGEDPSDSSVAKSKKTR